MSPHWAAPTSAHTDSAGRFRDEVRDVYTVRLDEERVPTDDAVDQLVLWWPACLDLRAESA